MEPILEKLKLDFDSDVPLEEQKKEGMNFLREHYRKLIEAAMSERAERVKHAREAYLKELEVDVVLSTADIRSRRFECDMGDLCQHTACCIMSNTSFSCLDCCPKSFVSVAPVMHDEHREAILHSCTSIIDECVFDKHVPPPSLCQHFWCRQVVLAHLKEGSTQHLQYCSCGAIVCEECFNSDECVDNAIYDSRAWNNTDNDDDADDEPVSLRWNNLQDQYESVHNISDKSGYKGHLNTTPQYHTSCYGTTAEASIQLTAHHYAQGWNLPQGSITDLADFMQKWLNESAIVGDSPSAPATLKGRLSSSLSESLDFIASKIENHINGNTFYNENQAAARANNVVTSLRSIVELAASVGGIMSLEEFESADIHDVNFPWSNFTGGESRLAVSEDVKQPAPIDETKSVDIRALNPVMGLVFSKKDDSNGDSSYVIDECFQLVKGTSNTIDEANKEKEINLCYYMCESMLLVFIENDQRLGYLLRTAGISSIEYNGPQSVDGVNLSLGDMMDIISNDDAREQVLHAFDLDKIDKYMIMDIIKEYMQRNVLADKTCVPFICKDDNCKHYPEEKVAEVEKKITKGIVCDKERILHQASLVENEVS